MTASNLTKKLARQNENRGSMNPGQTADKVLAFGGGF